MRAGHELTDVKVAPLLQFGVMLAVIVVLTMWGMLKAHDAMEAYFARSSAPAHPMQSSGGAPVGPRLQVNEARDYKIFRDAQQAQTVGDSAYAWIDQPADVVQVPIDRAMELVLQQGLPHRPTSK